MSDFTEFQLWYDINTDTLRHRISTKLGVNIAYPEFWVGSVSSVSDASEGLINAIYWFRVISTLLNYSVRLQITPKT
jgi:hypothetical protein